jgi:hypothetical protein
VLARKIEETTRHAEPVDILRDLTDSTVGDHVGSIVDEP